MYKNVQANPKKSQKLTKHCCCSMLTLGKNLKSRRGNGYRFVQKGERFPTETITLVVRSLYPNLPQMGQKIYHGMLMPLHDSMPNYAMTWMTTVTREIRTKKFYVQTHHTRVKLSE